MRKTRFAIYDFDSFVLRMVCGLGWAGPPFFIRGRQLGSSFHGSTVLICPFCTGRAFQSRPSGNFAPRSFSRSVTGHLATPIPYRLPRLEAVRIPPHRACPPSRPDSSQAVIWDSPKPRRAACLKTNSARLAGALEPYTNWARPPDSGRLLLPPPRKMREIRRPVLTTLSEIDPGHANGFMAHIIFPRVCTFSCRPIHLLPTSPSFQP